MKTDTVAMFFFGFERGVIMSFQRVTSAATILFFLSMLSVSGAIPAHAATKTAPVVHVLKVKNETTKDAYDFHVEYDAKDPGKFSGSGKRLESCGSAETGTPPNVTLTIDCQSMTDNFVKKGESETFTFTWTDDKNKAAPKPKSAYWTDKDKNEIASKIPLAAHEVEETKSAANTVQTSYTIGNPTSFDLLIEDLAFLFDVPSLLLGSIDPGETPGFDTAFAPFILSSGDTVSFVFGPVAPGNYLYAQGTSSIAGSGEAATAFVYGHAAPIPLPASAWMLASALCFLTWRKRRQMVPQRISPEA